MGMVGWGRWHGAVAQCEQRMAGARGKHACLCIVHAQRGASQAQCAGQALTHRPRTDTHTCACALPAAGDTPLALAAATNAHKVVRLLLKRGADVGLRKQPDGAAAVHRAAGARGPDALKLLLEAGADPLLASGEAGPGFWRVCLLEGTGCCLWGRGVIGGLPRCRLWEVLGTWHSQVCCRACLPRVCAMLLPGRQEQKQRRRPCHGSTAGAPAGAARAHMQGLLLYRPGQRTATATAPV